MVLKRFRQKVLQEGISYSALPSVQISLICQKYEEICFFSLLLSSRITVLLSTNCESIDGCSLKPMYTCGMLEDRKRGVLWKLKQIQGRCLPLISLNPYRIFAL